MIQRAIAPAATIITWGAALYPLIWSGLALAYPFGTGWLWQGGTVVASPQSGSAAPMRTPWPT